jgi:hypothetical protein
MAKQLLNWERQEAIGGDPPCWNLMVNDGSGRAAATVWDNGTWHTWDQSQVGGENSREESVEKAKIEAAASAIDQGFI